MFPVFLDISKHITVKWKPKQRAIIEFLVAEKVTLFLVDFLPREKIINSEAYIETLQKVRAKIKYLFYVTT